MTRRSPNVLSVGDRVLCWTARPHAVAPVVVRGFVGDRVYVEDDDPISTRSWFAAFTDLTDWSA